MTHAVFMSLQNELPVYAIIFSLTFYGIVYEKITVKSYLQNKSATRTDVVIE